MVIIIQALPKHPHLPYGWAFEGLDFGLGILMGHRRSIGGALFVQSCRRSQRRHPFLISVAPGFRVHKSLKQPFHHTDSQLASPRWIQAR